MLMSPSTCSLLHGLFGLRVMARRLFFALQIGLEELGAPDYLGSHDGGDVHCSATDLSL